MTSRSTVEYQTATQPVFYWVRHQNQTEAAKITLSLGSGVGARGVDELAARVVGMLQRKGLDVNSGNMRHDAQLMSAAGLAGVLKPGASRAEDTAAQALPTLRELAVGYAGWWSDKQISDGIDKLARERGIGSPVTIALMKSLLLEPSMTLSQRAMALNRPHASVSAGLVKLRELLQFGNTSPRTALAERIGMPLTAVVARIRPGDDPGVTQRVMNAINPSHREGVAELLLSVTTGSETDTKVYRALDVIFHGGDPYASRNALAAKLGGNYSGATTFLHQTFAGDRLSMLRTMGFSYQQILRMNPVGRELSKRFDPALGTFSASERALRQEKRLPNTAEEAAERMLRAGQSTAKGIASMGYRSWLAVGLLSDKSWLLPSDLNDAYTSLVPASTARAGSSDLTIAFATAQRVLGRDIPRGVRSDLMDRGYRQEINLLLLQTFGLGAIRIGSGALEPIPTNFKVSDWPSPSTEPTSPEQRASPTDHGTHEATWQELLPLLQRKRPARTS